MYYKLSLNNQDCVVAVHKSSDVNSDKLDTLPKRVYASSTSVVQNSITTGEVAMDTKATLTFYGQKYSNPLIAINKVLAFSDPKRQINDSWLSLKAYPLTQAIATMDDASFNGYYLFFDGYPVGDDRGVLTAEATVGDLNDTNAYSTVYLGSSQFYTNPNKFSEAKALRHSGNTQATVSPFFAAEHPFAISSFTTTYLNNGSTIWLHLPKTDADHTLIVATNDNSVLGSSFYTINADSIISQNTVSNNYMFIDYTPEIAKITLKNLTNTDASVIISGNSNYSPNLATEFVSSRNSVELSFQNL